MKTLIIFQSTQSVQNFLKDSDPISLNNVHYLICNSDSKYLLEKVITEKKIFDFDELLHNVNFEKLFNQSIETADSICSELDTQFSSKISVSLGIKKIKFFHTIYPYSSSYRQFHFYLWETVLTKLRSSIQYHEIILYPGQAIYEPYFSLPCYLDHYCSLNNTTFLLKQPLQTKMFYKKANEITKRIKIMSLFKIQGFFFRLLDTSYNHSLNKIKNKFSKIKFSLVLSGRSKYKFHLPELNNYIEYNQFFKSKHIKKAKHKIALLQLDNLIKLNAELPLLKKTILEDFQNNHQSYLAPLIALSHSSQKNRISSVIWGLPLIFEPEKNLLLDYFFNTNIPVIGRQHGCSYVSQINPLHFHSDFNRCNKFYSYGFEEKEFRSAYPAQKPFCKIIPKKQIMMSKPRMNASAVDIIFPIANSKTEFLYEQKKIIQSLIARPDLKIIIKPVAAFNKFFDFKNLIKDYQHIKLVENVNFNEMLKIYKTNLFVFEVPSTTFDECLSLDVDIFLRSSRLFKFSPVAHSMIEKRANIFDS